MDIRGWKVHVRECLERNINSSLPSAYWYCLRTSLPPNHPTPPWYFIPSLPPPTLPYPNLPRPILAWIITFRTSQIASYKIILGLQHQRTRVLIFVYNILLAVNTCQLMYIIWPNGLIWCGKVNFDYQVHIVFPLSSYEANTRTSW